MALKRDSRGRLLASPVSQHTTRTVKIGPGMLKSALIGESKRASRAMPKAAMAAARRFVRYLADVTDDLGITDRGILKNSWKAVRSGNGATVFSDAPHAGIVELGARPHKVSPEARQLIAEWAMRKLGLSPEDAQQASWAIANKIRTRGQEPRYLVRDSMPEARLFFAQEFKRVMQAEPRPRPVKS